MAPNRLSESGRERSVSGPTYGRLMRSMILCVLALLATATFATAAGADQRPPCRVVAFGDSYAAGEGAPGTPGVYDADGTHPHPRAVWSGSDADTAFTGDAETGTRGARRCHRSPRATAPRAVKALITRFPDIDFTFRPFACSGAAIDVGVHAGHRPRGDRVTLSVRGTTKRLRVEYIR